MKFVEEFNRPETILPLIEKIKKEVKREYRFMEFCGGHTHALFKSGLIDILPKEITMVHGPGCPVCVLPAHPIKNIIRLLEEDENIILTSYADMMRVPTDDGDSLLGAKGRGRNIVPIYSPDNALQMAINNPDKKIIFLAIGFETTTPPTAMVIKKARDLNLENFFVYCNHLNTAKALEHLLEKDKMGIVPLDGLIGPGHVSLITGADFFNDFAQSYKKPIVISGFAPYDLAQSLLMLVQMVNESSFGVKVQYSRAVSSKGNIVTQKVMDEILELREVFEWRGVGPIKKSGFKIKDQFAKWDAEKVFSLNVETSKDHPACLCPKVLMGEKNPMDCKLFGTVCTPERPLGPCMVSSEGACSAYFQAGRHIQKEGESWANL